MKKRAKKIKIVVPPEYLYVLEEVENLVDSKQKLGIKTSVSYELMKLAKKAIFEDTGPQPSISRIPKIIRDYAELLNFNLSDEEID